MNRRQLLKSSLLGATSLFALKAMGQSMNPSTGLSLQVTISRNHGHDLNVVSTDEFIVLLRKIETEGSTSLSIQGRSRHPHNIEIDSQMAMDILLGKEVTTISTRDAGHSHQVTLRLS